MIASFNPEDKKILKEVLAFAKIKKIKLYLVGGVLRDILLKRSKVHPDIDFCLRKGAINFARNLAKEIHAGFVVLDKEHGAARLVKKIKDKTYTLDFTDFRGKDLDDDLLHRDFTINALALELEKALTCPDFSDSLIDPYSGTNDLKRKLIRAPAKYAFAEDPLRILRAFSFACTLGFAIDKETLKIIKHDKDKISQVSFERIRDELFKILHTEHAFECLQEIDRLKILELIFPEVKPMRGLGQGPYHHLDIWKHTLETIRQLEDLIRQQKNASLQGYLNQVISSERKRMALIKLGALLHDIGKPKALRREDGKIKFHGHESIGSRMSENIARRLKLSNDETDILKKMVLCHLRPGYLADSAEITARARFRYFRDTADEAVSILLVSLADQRSTRGPLTTRQSRLRHEKTVSALIKEYFRAKKEKKLPRLINGNDLMRKFRLSPSPLIGKILREIEESQAIGKIASKKQALLLASKLLKR